jgi:hypothetical protein
VAEDSGANAINVLANDNDGPDEGETLAVTSVTQGAHGTVTITGGGTGVSYAPAADYFGTDTFTYTISDGHGGTDTATVNVTVTPVNDAPVIGTMAVSPDAINENDTATLSATFTDKDSSSFVLTINWGDGTAAQNVNCPTAGQCALGSGTWSVTVQHQYLDDNPTNSPSNSSAVTLTVDDGTGPPNGTDSESDTITVNNVDPTKLVVSGPAGPVVFSSAVTLTASFTEGGTLDTHSCTFAWDDGTANTTVSDSNGAGSDSCSASHSFTGPGVYTVTVTVTDDDTGSTSSTFEFVVAYDPNGGFVTGGGWILSPAGAYTLNPALTGKANFGFVAKYDKGVAKGQTEFQFHAGDFNFNSEVYESLVVSGYKAQYRGFGKVNGVSGYKFTLTAYDGQVTGGQGVDRFRIRITTLNNQVVYDNRNGVSEDMDLADPQAIASGSIVIHKGK